MLPVLLGRLRWQANELARPLVQLKAMDNNGLLRRTLRRGSGNAFSRWRPQKRYLFTVIRWVSATGFPELTGLDLGNFDDRLLLYVALQLDGSINSLPVGALTLIRQNAGRGGKRLKRHTNIHSRCFALDFQIGFNFADLVGHDAFRMTQVVRILRFRSTSLRSRCWQMDPVRRP